MVKTTAVKRTSKPHDYTSIWRHWPLTLYLELHINGERIKRSRHSIFAFILEKLLRFLYTVTMFRIGNTETCCRDGKEIYFICVLHCRSYYDLGPTSHGTQVRKIPASRLV